MSKTKNRASYTTALKEWSRNRILKIGQQLAHMVIVLPKAIPLYPSSDTAAKKNKTNTTAAVVDGIKRKELIEFWEDGYQVWPQTKDNE